MPNLIHATHRRNLASIYKAGLLTSKSRGKRPAVWLASPSLATWAILHVVQRHRAKAEDVVVLTVQVPAGWLRRHRKGLSYILRDVPPERLKTVRVFGELAAS